MKITKDTQIGEIVKKNPRSAEIMIKYGLGCACCPMAAAETLEQGASAHGMSPEEIKKIINELNNLSK